MRKYLFTIITVLLLATVAFAAPTRGVLVDSSENPIGTADNPIYITGASVNGTDITVGNLTVNGILGKYITVNTVGGIQLAIDELSNNSLSGGTVVIEPGIYNLTDTIMINTTNNIWIRGEGAFTRLRANNSQDIDVMYLGSNCTKLKISDLIIDGNNLNQTTGGYGIKADINYSGDVYITFSNLNIFNCKKSGFYIPPANSVIGLQLVNVQSKYGNDTGFEMRGSDHNLVNCVAGNNAGHGFLIADYNSHYTNCKAFGSGISDWLHDGFNVYSNKVSFVNCEAQENRRNGFYINGSQINIVGCILDANGFNISSNSSGIYVSPTSKGCIIEGNSFVVKSGRRQSYGVTLNSSNSTIISNNYFSGINITGISLMDNVSNSVISGNIIRNCQEGPGISISSEGVMENIKILDNILVDNQVTPTQTYGVLKSGAGVFNNLQIFNNNYFNNTLGTVSGLSSTDFNSSINNETISFPNVYSNTTQLGRINFLNLSNIAVSPINLSWSNNGVLSCNTSISASSGYLSGGSVIISSSQETNGFFVGTTASSSDGSREKNTSMIYAHGRVWNQNSTGKNCNASIALDFNVSSDNFTSNNTTFGKLSMSFLINETGTGATRTRVVAPFTFSSNGTLYFNGASPETGSMVMKSRDGNNWSCRPDNTTGLFNCTAL